MAVPRSALSAVQTATNVESHAILELGASGSAGEALVEAARRSLKRFFDKMRGFEDSVFDSEEATSIHQMRVATRRLRTSLQILEGVFDPKLIRRYRRSLREIAESLGEVRDGDVFLEHVVAYGDSLPMEQRGELAPLVAAITAKRARGRKSLLKFLQGKSYAKFVGDFTAFLETPGKGELPSPVQGISLRIRDFAGSAILQRYELWRAYETVLEGASEETRHQARIAGKKLRYAIEFFADALGPDIKGVIDPLIALQDCLGELQDGVTARERIVALRLADDPGAKHYLVARQAERGVYLKKLPRLWAQVASATYQRRLFRLIVML